ncbi:large ribosomal subunit protein eL6 isoform X1 [Rhipicephalus microplus]|uniref:large ribosomal subunit protein eL6 isoform X1 n=1 Tax=Rhipicephalus microplus TaxID=6941 RepID=UPI003F6A882C
MSGKPDPKAKKAPAAAKSAAKGASAVAKGDAAVPKKAHAPRNQKLPGGVWLFSRSKMFHKRGLFKVKHAPVPKEKRKRKKRVHVKKINGDNNGGKRVVHIKKERRSYPTEDSPKHKRTTHMKPSSLRIAKLRKRITPGTILILLAGPHRGKRVVFLKQLKTGLLMVTGPYGINGCPLRRINQIYVIATSTKIDISSVKLPENLDDRFFNRPKSAKRRSRKDEGEIFDTKPQERTVSDEHRKVQKEVDKQVLEAMKKHPEKRALVHYLAASFSLRNRMYPHRMKF